MLHANDMGPEALIAAARAADPANDAAVARIPSPVDEALVVAIDTLVSGVHFRAEAKSEDVAHKALAVNLSDLAAMGAAPLTVAVSLSADPLSGPWMEGFRRGLARAAGELGVEVAAAALAVGPLAVTVEAVGRVPPDSALRRSGARPGDRIFVTGTLGDAGLGLALARGELSLPADQAGYVLARLDRPQPRVAAGAALRGLASSAIDLSDGLAGDLGHVLRRSGAGARVNVDRLPRSPELKASLPEERALELALGFGDDYELCFTVPEESLSSLERRLDAFGCEVAEIGVVEAQPGLRLARDNGSAFAAVDAYDHFRA